MAESFEHFWMKKAKTLTQILIISGTLNIGLLATFIYFVLKEKEEAFSFNLDDSKANAAAKHLTNEQVLRAYSHLPMQELLLKLENKDLVEDGYGKRDVALGCLVAFHHFNIDKALGGYLLQKRILAFRNQDGTELAYVVMFPGLIDEQFEAILSYAKTEKWPFTTKGLFFELQRGSPPYDPFLVEAFCLSSEYHAVATLFAKTDLNMDKGALISLLAEGQWSYLQEFTEKQRLLADFSLEQRRMFLLTYLQHSRSKIAAKLFLEMDQEFILRRCGDGALLTFLDLLEEEKLHLQNLAKELLMSPRSDEIRKRAALILYANAGETPPEVFDHMAALKRFAPESIALVQKPIEQAKPALESVAASASTKPAKDKKNKTHVIKEGDSLWKIARKYGVSIEAIKKANHLETEKLRSGKELIIPDANKT